MRSNRRQPDISWGRYNSETYVQGFCCVGLPAHTKLFQDSWYNFLVCRQLSSHAADMQTTTAEEVSLWYCPFREGVKPMTYTAVSVVNFRVLYASESGHTSDFRERLWRDVVHIMLIRLGPNLCGVTGTYSLKGPPNSKSCSSVSTFTRLTPQLGIIGLADAEMRCNRNRHIKHDAAWRQPRHTREI